MAPRSQDTHTVHLKLQTSELEKIDAWAEAMHISTRSQAIRQIIHDRLAEDGVNYELSEKDNASFARPSRRVAKQTGGGSDDLEKMIKKLVKKEIAKALKK